MRGCEDQLIFCTGFCLAGLTCLEHSVQILPSLKLAANASQNRVVWETIFFPFVASERPIFREVSCYSS